MDDAGAVVYRVDREDKIVCVNEAWDRYAAANAGETVASGKILRRSLWDFISDVSTRELYRTILKHVRAGARVRFPLRCDSADCRRFVEMNASLVDRTDIRFLARTTRLEKRPPVALLNPALPRSGALLKTCGWCKKVKVGGLWVEVEDAVSALGLFESYSLPMLTHGMCEDCAAAMARTLGMGRPAP